MKTSTMQISLAAMLTGVNAFPHMAAKMAEELQKRQVGLPGIPLAGNDFTGVPTLVFNAQDQHVDVSGSHAYVAPNFAAGDTRGPCPGLNALANHGYINHNGKTNLLQAIAGTNAGFNMAVDLGGFLSAYSVLFDGNILSQEWSIGNGSPASTSGGGGLLGSTVGGILGGVSDALLGVSTGLTGSHNKYETDSSPMRGDFYEYCGNNYEVQLSQYQELYDYYKGIPDDQVSFTFPDLAKFRNSRFTESVQNNPNFYYGPFTGLIVSQAAFTFIPAFMYNHSAEYPNGRLSRATLNSFFGVTETGGTGKGDGKLTYNPGTERFPENWYRRSSTNPYSITSLVLDSVRIQTTYPQIASVGGNTNGVNTFSGVDLADVTGGVLNSANLLQGNNLACFGYQFSQQLILDSTKGLLGSTLSAVNSLLGQYISPVLSTLSCPQLTTIDESQLLNGYPGAQSGTQKPNSC